MRKAVLSTRTTAFLNAPQICRSHSLPCVNVCDEISVHLHLMVRSRPSGTQQLVSGCMFYFPLSTIYAEH